MKNPPETEAPKEFYFWRIVAVCGAVVTFCALSAWVVSEYFY